MKHIVALLVVCLLLCGCQQDTKEMDIAMATRQNLLNSGSCSFDAQVITEYSDKVFTFLMRCSGKNNGDVSFVVLEPESIAGITGSITETGGNFTFDDTVLAFQTLADDTVSPIIAPWLVLRSLRGGYIRQCAKSTEGICMDVDDTYRGVNLHTTIYLSSGGSPEGAELYYDGRRILTVRVSNFTLL